MIACKSVGHESTVVVSSEIHTGTVYISNCSDLIDKANEILAIVLAKV